MQEHSAELTFKCYRCGQQKPQGEFPKSKQRRIRTCEACRNLAEKPCVGCRVVQPIETFRWNTGNDGKKRRDSLCAECRNRRMREWNAKHRTTKVRNQNLIKNYGITLDDYNRIFQEQAGACAICGDAVMPIDPRTKEPYQLAVDHCHDCGGVRALLCPGCNNGLGCFRDDPKRLQAAIEYLVKHKHSA